MTVTFNVGDLVEIQRTPLKGRLARVLAVTSSNQYEVGGRGWIVSFTFDACDLKLLRRAEGQDA